MNEPQKQSLKAVIEHLRKTGQSNSLSDELAEHVRVLSQYEASLKDCAIDVWHVEDVKSRRPDLSGEQCREVLRDLVKNHDAEIGINWDTIDYAADARYAEPENIWELRRSHGDDEMAPAPEPERNRGPKLSM